MISLTNQNVCYITYFSDDFFDCTKTYDTRSVLLIIIKTMTVLFYKLHTKYK